MGPQPTEPPERAAVSLPPRITLRCGMTRRGVLALALHTGVAWSTAKVPVTVAALQRSSSASTRSRAQAAITRSDNAAAEKLWRSLGRPATAGRRTQAVFGAAGDRR